MKRLARLTLWGVVVSVVLTLVAVGGAWHEIVHGSLIDPARFARTDDSVTVVDRHGVPLRNSRSDGFDRRWVPLREISPNLISAVLAAEDRDFRAHDGIDFRAIMRAAVTNLIPRRHLSGASTITQQLVKLVYHREPGLRGKVTEMLRAAALERTFSKDEILEQYLNRVPFGDQIEGIERASEEYFGHSATSLSVAESALLAGIPQGPSMTEPRRHLARAVMRRDFVLGRMHSLGWIDERVFNAAIREVPVIRSAQPRPYEAPRFVDGAVAAWHSGSLAENSGTVTTSLDLALQHRVESVLANAVDRFDARGVRNGAAIVLANVTGEALAYVSAARTGDHAPGGGLDLLWARRQPGSTLKPFVYEMLFERGATAATILDDMATPMMGAHGTSFEARDYDGHERGPVRARVALSSSLNLAALDAARRVGSDALLARLSALGITGLSGANHYGPAVVLGGADIAPAELARAYLTLARGGSSVPLSFHPGTVPESHDVMSPNAVRTTWDILSDSSARTDAFGSDLVQFAGGEPFALKTGTSAGWHDAWAAVANDRFTVVVWLGNPDGGALAEVSGFEAAAPAAARILAAANDRANVDGVVAVVRPALPVVTTEVCAFTGLRPGPNCHRTIAERFTPGSVPRAMCQSHDGTGRCLVGARYVAWATRAHPSGVALDSRAPVCANPAPEVREPRDGARWILDASRGETAVSLRATSCGAPDETVEWTIDGVRARSSRWIATRGTHHFVAIAHGLRSQPSVLEVAEPTH